MPAQRKHHVFLIPGFLGIENLGDVVYFAHVRDLLTAAFAEHGLPVEIHAVRNYATASLRKRTLRLIDNIAERAGNGDEPLHLIGHSTGGLDARLFCTPGASIGGTQDVEALARRVRSLVSICTPHRGTPLASYFTTRLGAQLLGVLSLGTFYVLRFGRLPIAVVVRLATLFVKLQGRLGNLEHTVAHQLFDQLLGDFSPERRDELGELFECMANDQALMPQLMPESMDVFDAAVGPRPGIRCGSVVTCAGRASLRGVLRLGFDPYAQATHALFSALQALTADSNAAYLPQLSSHDARALEQALHKLPDPSDNDGIVPTLSQVWGELIHAVPADHFDVIGHFADPQRDPPHYDWLASGSGFSRAHFETLWRKVAGFIAEAARERPLPGAVHAAPGVLSSPKPGV